MAYTTQKDCQDWWWFTIDLFTLDGRVHGTVGIVDSVAESLISHFSALNIHHGQLAALAAFNWPW